jgi:hypothetical protein
LPRTESISHAGQQVHREPASRAIYKDVGANGALPRIRSEAFSATMIVGALVLLDVTNGITEASTTRIPRSPRSLRSGVTTASGPEPIAQVPAGW